MSNWELVFSANDQAHLPPGMAAQKEDKAMSDNKTREVNKTTGDPAVSVERIVERSRCAAGTRPGASSFFWRLGISTAFLQGYHVS